MSIITRRNALTIVPAAITTLVPFPAATKIITVRKTCPVERFWQNFKQAEKDYKRAVEQPGAGNFDTPECVEAWERYYFNRGLLSSTVPTSAGGQIALAEFAHHWVTVDYDPDETTIESNAINNLIASLKQLPA